MEALLDRPEPALWVAGVNRPLAISDFLAAPDTALVVRQTSASELPAAGAGTLFAHPAWLRAYATQDLVVVEGPGRDGPPVRLTFARRPGHLVHLGRLLAFEPDCLAFLSERLLRLAGVAFVVFEDVHVAGEIGLAPGRAVFRYQNNWRLVLNGPTPHERPSRQTAQATARKLRQLVRERPGIRLGFDKDPPEALLRRVVALNRAKIEAQGRRHGIDEAEFARLSAVAAELGRGAVLEDGEEIVAGDLICVADDRPYFLTGGYDPAFQRFSPGMITLGHAIEECRRQGVLDFNLLWGDGAYKERLGGRCQPLVTVVTRAPKALLRPSYPAALCRYGWLHLKRALKPLLRRSSRGAA